MNEKEKTTVPIPSVGADGEQSLSYVTNEIIATGNEEINPLFRSCAYASSDAENVGPVLSGYHDYEPAV